VKVQKECKGRNSPAAAAACSLSSTILLVILYPTYSSLKRRDF
jgi:hypothetical protein